MRESVIEKMLNINTSKAETRLDKIDYYSRYEPTPYEALETLFKQYTASKDDHFVDFGSGKGRFSFFVNYFFNSACTSVELVEEFHNKALMNFENYKKRNPGAIDKLFYINEYAEKYEVSKFENKFYFFNPFSVNIFIAVVNQIIKSVENFDREVELILYYPSSDYINFLERRTAFTHLVDIPCKYFYKDTRDRFSIYSFGKNLDCLDDDYSLNINIKSVLYQETILYKKTKEK